ncbi:MAG: DUF1428 domain-containing protein [Puniceicoccaceae bacterium]
MSKYIDGYVFPVPHANIENYRAVAAKAAAIWKDHGALEYIEAVGDDLEVKDMVSFSQLAGTGEGETVVFAYIVYASREHRDAVNAKVMADPRMAEMCPQRNPDFKPSFDWTRMSYGGFKTIVEA